MNQKILDKLLEGYRINYSDVFQFLDSLDNVDDLDLTKLEKRLLFDVMNDDIDLREAYQYSDKYNPSFRDKLDENVNGFCPTNKLTYLLLNDIEEDEISKHIEKVFQDIMYDYENVRELVQEFKEKMQKQGLFELTIDKLKQSKNMKSIIIAALVYDTDLIEEIFDNKLNLYYYILDNLEIDNDEIENMMEFVANMNDGEVKKQIVQKSKKYEERLNK